jgi:hypothetical protein
MRELQSLLAKRETAIAINFDHLNQRIRCYAHIINICSSHIIASVTTKSKSPDFEIPTNSNYVTRDDSSDESGDSDVDLDHDFDSPELDDLYDEESDSKLREWSEGIKRDPLRRARRIIRLLRSSDQRREGFRRFIQDGNRRCWFTTKENNGKRVTVQVPELQPLRDVKTRWDSVYMMLQRLRQLRPVSRLADWTVAISMTNCFT